MIFWRIVHNKLYQVNEVEKLGFEESEGLVIPDEYLESQQFTILRMAQGIGDWGIISAMPRLLKEKYPNCKVYVSSKEMVHSLLGHSHNNMEVIFKNNPYVDSFKDYIRGEIFHDHYRIYDKDNPNIPLIEQILKFWQFKSNEYKDSKPEMYWSDKEIEIGDSIINETVGSDEFGALLISDRFGTQCGKYDEKSYNSDTEKITKVLKDNPLPYFYYSFKQLRDTPFNFINKALDLRYMDIRIQLYIRSKAKLNVGNQCGTMQTVSRYSEVYTAQRQFPIGGNFIKDEIYL